MDRTIEGFIKYQSEADEKYRKWEEERWKKEAELDEKRRKEEREHEMRLFQMLAQMAKPNPYPSQQYNFNYEY